MKAFLLDKVLPRLLLPRPTIQAASQKLYEMYGREPWYVSNGIAGDKLHLYVTAYDRVPDDILKEFDPEVEKGEKPFTNFGTYRVEMVEHGKLST